MAKVPFCDGILFINLPSRAYRAGNNMLPTSRLFCACCALHYSRPQNDSGELPPQRDGRAGNGGSPQPWLSCPLVLCCAREVAGGPFRIRDGKAGAGSRGGVV